jgi:hypothetical protein
MIGKHSPCLAVLGLKTSRFLFDGSLMEDAPGGSTYPKPDRFPTAEKVIDIFGNNTMTLSPSDDGMTQEPAHSRASTKQAS